MASATTVVQSSANEMQIAHDTNYFPYMDVTSEKIIRPSYATSRRVVASNSYGYFPYDCVNAGWVDFAANIVLCVPYALHVIASKAPHANHFSLAP